MYDVDYNKWADYIEKIFAQNNTTPSLVLDLGCGTGSMCIEMSKKGYEMIGLDISLDMLTVAKEKSLGSGHDILYLNQDMVDFELYGTVDAVLCLMDSINYITDKRHLKKIFKSVHNYLNPGGLFIFDINSFYKLKYVLADNVFFDIGEDVTYIWQNSFDSKKNICEFDLTFFAKHGEYYKKYDEVHLERAYSIEEIKELALGCNLEILGIYDGLSFKQPSDHSERIFFVCSKNTI